MEPFAEQNKIVSPATIDRYFKSGGNREIYLTAGEDSFTAIISGLSAKDVTLIGLFCVENFEQHKGFTLLYAFEMRGAGNVVILLRHLTHRGLRLCPSEPARVNRVSRFDFADSVEAFAYNLRE